MGARVVGFGIVAARRLRALLGARRALRVLRLMITSSSFGSTRAAANLAALECAVDLGDDAAIEMLSTWWAAVSEPAARERAAAVIAALGAAASGGLAASHAALARLVESDEATRV
jgi:hypothetical protein